MPAFDPSSLLRPDAVDLDCQAHDVESAVRSLCARLHGHPALLDPSGFADDVLARERIQSTAFASGVAFPHARTARVGDIMIAAGRLRTPADFGGTPVRLVFVIGTPPSRTAEHLALLAFLARRLTDTALLRKLLDAESPSAFCETLAGLVPSAAHTMT